MLNEETPTLGLMGSYRDVLRDAAGQVTWDSGWRKNTILIGCRQLLAAFMCGEANTAGIQGLQVGAGDAAWDGAVAPQPPTTGGLLDPSPYTAPLSALKFSYLDPVTGQVSTGVTSRLQIVVTLGPNMPNWPGDGIHAAATLREFGLVGKLDNKPILLNAVRHVAIAKDPVSTLVRTIQLVF